MPLTKGREGAQSAKFLQIDQLLDPGLHVDRDARHEASVTIHDESSMIDAGLSQVVDSIEFQGEAGRRRMTTEALQDRFRGQQPVVDRVVGRRASRTPGQTVLAGLRQQDRSTDVR